MTALPNLALPVLALATGCFGSDKDVVKAPKSKAPPNVGLEDPPDPPPTPTRRQFRPDYIGEVRCWESDGSLVERPKFKELFVLRGTTFWYLPPGEEKRPHDFYVIRRGTELDMLNPLHVGDWIEDRWQIIYGQQQSVTVLTECNQEEVIHLWEDGFMWTETSNEPVSPPIEDDVDEVGIVGQAEREHGERLHDTYSKDGRQVVIHEDGTIVVYGKDSTAATLPATKFIYDEEEGGWITHTLIGETYMRSSSPVRFLEDIEKGLGFETPEDAQDELNNILDSYDQEDFEDEEDFDDEEEPEDFDDEEEPEDFDDP